MDRTLAYLRISFRARLSQIGNSMKLGQQVVERPFDALIRENLLQRRTPTQVGGRRLEVTYNWRDHPEQRICLVCHEVQPILTGCRQACGSFEVGKAIQPVCKIVDRDIRLGERY